MATPTDSRDTSGSFTSQDAATSNSANSSVPSPVANPYDLADPAVVRQIKKRIDERWKTAGHRRWLFELNWLRQVLFALDIQWVRIDYPGREIRNLSLPNNFPRSISNKYAQVNGDLMNQLIQGDIALNWTPATDDEEDVSTAAICERVREVIDSEVDVRKKKRDLGFWITYTGNGFIEVEYDYNPIHGTVPIPLQACGNCGDTSKPGEVDGAGDPSKALPCPACGTEPPAPQPPPAPTPDPITGIASPAPPAAPPLYSPAMNADGTPQTEDMPIGKLVFNSLSPFEVYFDNICRIGSNPGQQWYFKPRSYDVNVAKALFPDSAAKISEGMNEPMKPSRNYLIAIAYAGAYLTGTTGTGEASAREEMRRQVTAWQYKEMPTPEYPQGVYAVRIGDEVVELKPLPNVWGAGQLKGTPFLGLVQFYQEISGGAWAKARASRLISIQARRNIIESNLQLTAQRTGGPKLMWPVGAGLKTMSGEPGQQFEYKPITFGGASLAKPEYLEAALGNVQPLVELLKVLDDMQETIAGTRSVSGGDVPPGVVAASAISFLSEKANRSISPLKESWAESWAQVEAYGIEVARAHWTDQRILAILGRNKEWEFTKFKAADLAGGVKVSVDYEALFPKSQATERANMLQLVQMMAVNPSDPETNFKILEKFGATDLKQSQENSTLQAIREWDKFLETQQPPVLKPIVQDAQLHLLQHKKDATTQEYEMLPPEVQALWDAHIMATMTDVMASMQPLVPEAPPPSGGGGHPGSQPGSQHGSASGNLAPGGGDKVPAPIKKGQQAADGGAPPV